MDWSPGATVPLLYTIAEVARMFGWHRSTLYRHVREGRFPRPRQIAGGWRYTRADLDAYLLLAGRWEPGPFNPDGERDSPDAEEEDAGDAGENS